MSPFLNNRPTSELDFVHPGGNALIENDARGADSPASGRTPFRPDRAVLRERAQSRTARCGRSDQRPVSYGAGCRGALRAEAPGEPESQSQATMLHRVPLANGCRWARLTFRYRTTFRL